MKFFKINPNTDFNLLCSFINPHKIGQKIMSEKTKTHFILIKDISTPAANILKQDALRVGAELITHKEVITAKITYSNALLMATKEQIQKLINKEKLQDFGLKNLAKFLENDFSKPKQAELMAVINVNEDSFNADSRVSYKDFEERLNEILALNPEYIDIGAVSSRPKSVYCGKEEEFRYCGKEEEFRRLKNVLDLIYDKNYYEKAIFSLDSFDEYCLEYALNKGFKFINDISSLRNLNLAKLASKYNAKYCLMHMQNDPLTMQDDPRYDDLLDEMSSFFKEKLEILDTLGVKESILDVGIGFGKSAEHNMILIKHLEHFLQFKKPLLIGASRKSVINAYYESEVKDRLAGTLYLHLKAFENGASIIRVHDLYEHKQLFAMANAMQSIGV
ncbi:MULTISPECIES: dihydropteroate synthase [Campylobacter]|uniref:dihydropteroate synthase n=1 Tax=Campylobacter TaxID=194 RepID=UPI0007174486|nr:MULTISPECIES: dihydropteroate synthase [Campylobacter]AOH51600.1 dihydropteroate synthase [Campylobacter jejuni subsp. jejuni]EAI9746524.1 dihydropteroate synthase [Campylobacter jejuni]EAJ0218074.1 dihydropteroate synthase [Campylobacter jejuni]EAJ0299845.1 dihydropteroate synthase [Campylobacter jejuni]EAJ0699070.1 dihydropteroate synthase [Campylobacter jejuni]